MALHVRVVSRALLLRRFVEYLRERLHFAPVINLHLIQFVLECLQLRKIGGFLETRRVVIGLEGPVDVFGFVDEIQNERLSLPGIIRFKRDSVCTA